MSVALAWLLAATPLASGPMVVAPPDLLAPADEAWIAEAVADELPRALLELGVPVLERYDRLRVQERLGLPAVRLSRATTIKVAEAVGAWRLVTGTVEREGGVTLKIRLLDVPRGALAAPLVAKGPVESLQSLLAGVACDIALAASTPPARSREVLVALRTAVPFEAWRTHAQALAATDVAARTKLLRRALAQFPSYEEARLDLARVQLESREHAAALETVAKSGREARTHRATRFAEGVALLGLGRYVEAAAVYDELRQGRPTPAVLSNEAAARLRQGRRELPASAPLLQALGREPAALDLPVNLGFALLHENRPEAAAFFLKVAVKRDPGDSAARLLLSWALRQAGKEDEAEDEWRALSAMTDAFQSLRAPDLPRRFERVLPSEGALVVDAQGRSDAEAATAQQARGQKLLEAGDVAAAAVELASAVVLAPFDAETHALLARALRGRGEVARAEAELRASLYCRDDNAVRTELMDVLMAQGRTAEARKLLQEHAP